MLLVQLFSSPQQAVAPRTSSEPTEKEKLSSPLKERIMLDNVINPIAVHNLRLTFSLKISKAIIVVATISKLPSKEAFAEVPNKLTRSLRGAPAR